MISSIRLDGTTACLHLPGAADTAAFVTYIGEVLCPSTGTHLIMAKRSAPLRRGKYFPWF